MGDTNIEWATKVWNPTSGCTKNSPACDHCYAFRMSKRLAANPKVPHRERYNGFNPTCWPERLTEPLHWEKPQRIFVASMGDLFHEDIPTTFIDQVVEVFNTCPHHTFMVLTKRPQRMLDFFESLDDRFWPLRNVWLGVTTENQEQADKRIPILLQAPASVHFVSVEPMLGPIDFEDVPVGMLGPLRPHIIRLGDMVKLDWVICGSETGPGHRHMDPQWALNLKDQCVNAGVPFFFKGRIMQDGSKCRVLAGQYWEEFPEVQS